MQQTDSAVTADAVAAIFIEAGWTPGTKDGWGGKFIWRDGVTIGGIDPWGTPRTTGIASNPSEGPDTVEEAAAWLVEHAKQLRLAVPENNLASEATLDPITYEPPPIASAPEPEETPAHEADGETGTEAVAAEAFGELLGSTASGDGTSDAGAGSGVSGEDTAFHGTVDFTDAIDADFWDTPRNELDAAELGEEILEEHPEEFGTGPQFIFGDNLDQMRTAAIGLVMRYARSLMPAWEVTDDARLVELRNFVMGVSESRWPDDAAKQQELAGLEATLSRIGAIVKTRDAKVEFLETATREEIEAFVPEAGWP
jgi:hypothetical protein